MAANRTRDAVRFAALVCALLAGPAPGASQDSPAARGLAGLRVPEGFTVELAADAPGAMFAGLDERGRLFVVQFSRSIGNRSVPSGPRIHLLEDADRNGSFERNVVFADAAEPARIWCGQNGVWQVSRSELVRLADTDADGKADQRTVLLPMHFTPGAEPVMHAAGVPVPGPDGWLYLVGRPVGNREQQAANLARSIVGLPVSGVWRMRPDCTRIERFAGGLLSYPQQVAFLPSGEAVGLAVNTGGEQRPAFNALVHFVEGGHYGLKREPPTEFTHLIEPLPVLSALTNRVTMGLAVFRGTALGPGFGGNVFTVHLDYDSPGVVCRHVLTRNGATFRSEDSDFLTSRDPGFKPTDVLQDADGSLLVVNTGTNAAVYRIRRSDAPRPDDPRGDFLLSVAPRLSLAALVNSFQDPRPFVRDLAARLVRERVSAARSAAGALPELMRLRERSTDVESRCMAVHHLARFGALDPVAAALGDEHEDVRVAAARAIGDARRSGHPVSTGVFARLLDALRTGTPSVRREAATSLGALGNPAAGPVLLAAASEPADAFEDHAIVHALVCLGDRPVLSGALDSADERIRSAARRALTALDHK